MLPAVQSPITNHQSTINNHKSSTMNTLIIFIFFLVFSCSPKADWPPLPSAFKVQNSSYTQLTEKLVTWQKNERFHIEAIGESNEQRKIWAVKIEAKQLKNPVRILLVGQQHGNEPAGKEALIHLLDNLAANPDRLVKNIELLVVPMANPDGAEQNQRRNGVNADLNRDHVLLNEPETQALHRLIQQFQPHITVDCHEFGRDSRDYLDKGWLEWPLIMMDAANHPNFSKANYTAELDFLEQLQKYMAEKDINYRRYFVGGTPPEAEIRHSTLDIDDLRNGAAAYGGLSFIIESGVWHNAENPDANLHERVAAYLEIFHFLLDHRSFLKKSHHFAEKSASIPQLISVNHFWGRTAVGADSLPVIDKVSAEIKQIPLYNKMDQIVIKKQVPTPDYYLISREYADIFAPWLSLHGLQFDILKDDRALTIQELRSLSVSQSYDETYERYDGFHRTEFLAKRDTLLTAGSILIPIQQPLDRKALALLEPSQSYGPFSETKFQSLLKKDKILPICRAWEKTEQ
jgi:hypothetical protein